MSAIGALSPEEMDRTEVMRNAAIRALGRQNYEARKIEDGGIIIEGFKLKRQNRTETYYRIGGLSILFGVVAWWRMARNEDISFLVSGLSFLISTVIAFGIFLAMQWMRWKNQAKKSKQIIVTTGKVGIKGQNGQYKEISRAELSQVYEQIEKDQAKGILKISGKGKGINELLQFYTRSNDPKREAMEEVAYDLKMVRDYIHFKVTEEVK